MSSDTHVGVVVGGFLPIISALYSADFSEQRVVVARRALCETGFITEYHVAYNITRTFELTTIATNKFQLAPATCTASGELPHECMYSEQ